MLKAHSIKVVADGKAKLLRRAAKTTLNALPQKCFAALSHHVKYEITLSIVSAAAMKRLNRQYRKKNRPTDVLAFAALEGQVTPAPVRSIGDVVVCLDVAKKQSREYGVSLKDELHRLTVHGVLHLFGYDHERNAREAQRMFTLQEKILAKLRRKS